MAQTIGEKIRAIRKERGFTQKELGERAGIAEPTIRRYELGKLNPKIETIQKIADALGTTVWELSDPLFAGQEGTPVLKPTENASPETMEFFKQHEEGVKTVLNLLRLEQGQEKKLLEQIIKDFRILTDEGQEKAAERVHELTEVPKYQNASAIAFEQFKADHCALDPAGPDLDDATEEE